VIRPFYLLALPTFEAFLAPVRPRVAGRTHARHALHRACSLPRRWQAMAAAASTSLSAPPATGPLPATSKAADPHQPKRLAAGMSSPRCLNTPGSPMVCFHSPRLSRVCGAVELQLPLTRSHQLAHYSLFFVPIFRIWYIKNRTKFSVYLPPTSISSSLPCCVLLPGKRQVQSSSFHQPVFRIQCPTNRNFCGPAA
jgi:hypothetical protein